MLTLYSNPRFEITETKNGHVYVTDHDHEEKKTEAANAAQAASIRAMIEEICDEHEPEDAAGLVEFLDDECLRIVYHNSMIHDRITHKLTLYKFSAYNTQPMYGWGDDADADAYCDCINIDRAINVYSYSAITDASEIAKRDGDGVNLQAALQEISEQY